MGGFIAQTLALQHPDRVNKLILLSTDSGGSEADLPSSGCVVTTRRYFRHASRPG
jgi:pimeloyl-ACP methyl ester carboxylesterase